MTALGLIGVPTSAGAFAPGQELAPGALRAAGLVERLRAAGVDVADRGDRPLWRWRPDRERPRAQNLDAVVELVRETAGRVREALAAGELPLVLGGDCTLEVGTVAGHVEAGERIGLVYLDLHPDLNVPDSVPPGALDWMGMAHLLGVDGATEPLRAVASLEDSQVVFLGYGPEQTKPFEHEVIERRGLRAIPVDEVAADPEGTAERALELDADRLLVHFDVDIIDYTDAQLSENAGRNEGLTLDATMRALARLLADERVGALTITELNPLHGDEEGAELARFLDRLVPALAGSPRLRAAGG
jgi:arginase